MKSPASDDKKPTIIVTGGGGEVLQHLTRQALATSECIGGIILIAEEEEKEPSMLNEYMLYAREMLEWPGQWEKDFKRKEHIRASRGKGKATSRNKKPNRLHVSRKTKMKHRRSR